MPRNFQEATMTGVDGSARAIYDMPAGKPKGHVYIVHGWAEHAGRYQDVANWIADLGYSVHALDHVGHGKSAGVRGHVARWKDYAADLKKLMDRDGGADENRYVLGHSMGGCISVLFALEYPGVVRRMALSGPATDISLPVPPAKAMVGRLFSSLWPSLTMPNDVDPKHVCTNPDVVKDYESDPLVHNKVSTRFFVEYVATIDRIKKEARNITTPIGIWHGEEDRVVEPWISQQLFDRLTCEPRERHIVAGMYHEILFERNGKETFDQMAGFLFGS